jgi:tetratricopeptide (TPR) repeat protein
MPDVEEAVTAAVYGASRDTDFTATAFLLTSELAITAFHVVGDRSSSSLKIASVQLRFPDGHTTADVIEFDARSDVAILRLRDRRLDDGCNRVSFLHPVSLNDPFLSSGWPQARPFAQDKMQISGEVVHASAAIFNGVPAIQLYCKQAAAMMRLQGFSGAPVLVPHAGKLCIAGMIRWNPLRSDLDGVAEGGTVYATSIDVILGRWPELLGETYPRLIKRERSTNAMAGGDGGGAKINQLPRAPVHFTGRARIVADLASHAVTARGAVVTIHTVDGMGGVGKTALAIHVSRMIESSFRDGVLFLDLHAYSVDQTPLEPLDALDRLLRSVGVGPTQIPPSLDERAALWRSVTSDKQLLVIIDNAASTQHVSYLLPGSNDCTVIVTSRRRLMLPAATVISLDVLTEDEAVDLLSRLAVLPASDEISLREIARLCGCLPLALQLAAAKLRHRRTLTPRVLAARLSDEQERLSTLESSDVQLSAAFDLSYRDLDQTLRDAFHRIAFHPGLQIASDAAGALIGCSTRDASGLLDKLYDEHLIDEIGDDRYRYHDLIRAFARDRATVVEGAAGRTAALHRLLRFYLGAVGMAVKTLEQERYQPAFIGLLASTSTRVFTTQGEALEWLDFERSNILALVDEPDVRADTDLWQLTVPLADYLVLRGYSGDAVNVLDGASALARSGGNLEGEWAATDILALALREQAQFRRSMEHATLAAELAKSGGEPRAESRSLQTAGFTLERIGDYDAATDILGRALRLAEDSGYRYGHGKALNSLGAVHWRQARYHDAERYFLAALEICQSIDDDYGQARVANNLGFTYQRLGDYDRALAFLNTAHGIGSRLRDRPLLTTVTNNIGQTLVSMQRYEEGMVRLMEGLELARESGDRYEQARSLHFGGEAASQRGDQALAHEQLAEALKLYTALGVPEADEVRRHV